MVAEVVNEMEYLRSREQKLRDTNESTNERVKWFAFGTMGMLIGLGAWQVVYLRAYFRSVFLIFTPWTVVVVIVIMVANLFFSADPSTLFRWCYILEYGVGLWTCVCVCVWTIICLDDNFFSVISSLVMTKWSLCKALHLNTQRK